MTKMPGFLPLVYCLTLGGAALSAAPAAAQQLPLPVVKDQYGDPLPPGAVARLGTMRFRHGYSYALAFAPGGKVLASGGRFTFGVCLWDAATGRPLHQLHTPNPILSLAFSADGKLVVTGSTLSVIDVATGKVLRRLEGSVGKNYDLVAFSPTGPIVAAVETRRTGAVVLWDANTGKELRRLKGQGGGAVAFSPDGKRLATACADKAVCLWDVTTGKELRRFPGHQEEIGRIVFGAGGKVLACTGGENQEIRLWDVTTGKLLHQLKLADTTVNIDFSPDGKVLASATPSDAVRLWDVVTGKELRHWHAGAANNVAFAPDGKVLATVNMSGVRLWDPATGQEIKPTVAHHRAIQALRWAADGGTLFSLCSGQQFLAWDPATGRERAHSVRQPPGPKEATGDGADISPDGKLVAQINYSLQYGRRDVVRVWAAATGKELWTLRGHPAGADAVRFAPDGKLLASGGSDGVRLWQLATGKQLHHLPVKTFAGTGFGFTPDGQGLMTAGVDQTLRLWAVATGKELRRWDSRDSRLSSLTVSPDGQVVAAESFGTGVSAWEMGSGKQLWQIGMPERTFGLAFSPTGRVLAATTVEDRTLPGGDRVVEWKIQLWEAYSGQAIRQIDVAGQELVRSLAFAPDGRTLASGGIDSTILLWDLTGQAQAAKKAAPLTGADLEKLWADLGGSAAKAEPALWALTRGPQQSVPFLQDRLRPAKPAAAEQVNTLVADLGGKTLPAREKAALALEALGEAAEAALRKVLAANPTLELRRRLEQVLAKREPDVLRQLRALEALEHVGTAAARQVLAAVAAGTPNPRLANAGSAALQRLDRRGTGRP